MIKTIITAVLLTLATATHAADVPRCTVMYMATLNGGAAVKPTTLTIRQSGKVVLESRKSSATIKTLQCGKLYEANVTTEIKPGVNVTHTRKFNLISSHRLIVAMDN